MPSIDVKEYFAVEGSPFSNKDARIIGPVIQALSEQGGVTRRDVLDAARSENSPLHSYFEWNDAVAADIYRLNQASKMLQSIKIKYVDGEVVSAVRAFHVEKVTIARDGSQRPYRAFTVLHGESAFAAQMMHSAFDDLRSWRRKYEPYENVWDNFSNTFRGVINQIDECESEIVHPNLPAFTDDAVAALISWKAQFIDAYLTWTEWVQQMRFVIEAIKEAESVFCATNEIKHRDCIRCGKSFLSYEGGHRMCRSCASLKSVTEASEINCSVG